MDMKAILIMVILIIAFACNSVFANEKSKKINRKNKMEISLKFKSHPYSFIKKLYKPNPVT
jgi:hypothetical protein